MIYPDGEELDVSETFHQHGANLAVKIAQATGELQPVIQRVGHAYRGWRGANLDVDTADEEAAVLRKAELYDEYRRVLDEPDVDNFDSRGALQSSALEEFCYYMLKPVLNQYSQELAVGRYDVFQGMYFTSENFTSFAAMPQPVYPHSTMDFIIGKRVVSRTSSDVEQQETSVFVAAVAIECKTYLDRPRFVETDYIAGRFKAGFPNCLFIVLSEYLKLDTTEVDLLRTSIDRIYVIRRSRNVDRKIRRAKGIPLEPVHRPALVDLYRTVKSHLTAEWSAETSFDETGILK